ncbi:hypothetical protein IFM89_037043 [Coptis chinensis]|uniref:WAT1-related protein n=1 Tax=Coptis chinensis TaxID=261450 RepID=A0A835H995_9MAGN|nr:hypothetical protein IFM89_037043 [Coptis chinensis]
MGQGLLPCLAMVAVEIGFAGMNIIMKLAMDSGMNPIVMVAYRQMVATLFVAPLAFLLERKARPKITKDILFHILVIGTLGATLNQCFYFVGLKHSTPTITCALNNLLPAFTFILAVPFKMETVGIKRLVGQAKVLGTILCVGGAMGKLSKIFPAPYTSTTLMCFIGSIECTLIGAIVEHRSKEWSLASQIRLIAILYGGIVGSGLAFCLMAWSVQKRGPLYVAAFSPLMLVIVAIFGWALLDEKFNVGSVVGSLLIVVGLYIVLWGKGRDMINPVKDDHANEKINVTTFELEAV